MLCGASTPHGSSGRTRCCSTRARRDCARAGPEPPGQVGVEEVAHRARLHADQRDLVAHRVVQLTGDPQPLLLHPAACFVFPPFLRAPGPLLEHGLVRLLGPDRLSDGGRHRGPRHHRHIGPPGLRVQAEHQVAGEQDADDSRGPRNGRRPLTAQREHEHPRDQRGPDEKIRRSRSHRRDRARSGHRRQKPWRPAHDRDDGEAHVDQRRDRHPSGRGGGGKGGGRARPRNGGTTRARNRRGHRERRPRRERPWPGREAPHRDCRQLAGRTANGLLPPQ